MISDLYAVLGVEKGDTLPNLKAAYRQRARETHPDLGGDPDTFRDVVFAWNILNDPDKKKRYDETGEIDFEYPRVTQKHLIKMLSDAIEIVLEEVERTGMPIEALNIAATLKEQARTHIGMQKAELEKVVERIRQIEHMMRAVKRKGEDENLFVTMLATKLEEAIEKRDLIAKGLHIARRYFEEIEMYDSPVDMMRAMQAGLYPIYGQTSASSTIDGYAPAQMFGFKF